MERWSSKRTQGPVVEEGPSIPPEPGLAVDIQGDEEEAAFEQGIVGEAAESLVDESGGVGHC